jgi:hypothetical protein
LKKEMVWFLYSSYYSTLMMEAIFSSETSVEFQRTTRRYMQFVLIL